MSMNVIETSSLGKRYGRTWALRECTLAIPAGHVAALVGPNGAGKTTLLNLAVGRPGQGTFVQATLSQVALPELTELRRSLSGWLTAADGAGLDEDGIVALFTREGTWKPSTSASTSTTTTSVTRMYEAISRPDSPHTLRRTQSSTPARYLAQPPGVSLQRGTRSPPAA